jgi:preprotein translocase subunit SecG
MLFGGSGGQDVFQKITWFLGALFMALSLLLALAKSQQSRTIYYSGGSQPVAASPLQPMPVEE